MKTSHPTQSLGDDLKAQASEVVRKVGDHFTDKVDQLHDTTAIARHDAQVYIESNPWQSVAIAAGIGFVLGVTVGRSVIRTL